MADYKELLRRAISALPENNGAARRAVYEKARSALVGQLRAITPPLPARDITQHRLQLEDCIRQVEQEASEAVIMLGRESAPTMRPTVPAATPAAPPAINRPAEAPKRAEQSAAPEPQGTQVASAAEPAPAKPAGPMSIEDIIEAAAATSGVDVQTVPAAAPPKGEQSRPEPHKAEPDKPEALKPEPVKPEPGSVTSIVARAEAGKAGPTSPLPSLPGSNVRSLETPNKSPAFEPRRDSRPLAANSTIEPVRIGPRIEPSLGNQAVARQQAAVPLSVVETAPVETALSTVREVEVEAAEPDTKEAEGAIERAIETLDREARGELTAPLPDRAGTGEHGSFAVAPAERPETGDDSGFAAADAPARSGGGLTIFLVVFALLLIGAGGAGFWAWREGYVDLNQMFSQGQPATTETADVALEPAPANDTTVPSTGPGNTATTGNVEPTSELEGLEIEDRLEPTPEPVVPNGTEATLPDIGTGEVKSEERLTEEDTAVAATNDPAASVDPAVLAGSQSLLLEASADGRAGAVPFSGTVEWSEGVDELGLPTLVGSASIPARNLGVNVTIRKNADPSLPASHLMEVDFQVSDTFIGGTIANLPGVLLKDEELVPGTPLIGASARVVGNSFLFALSASAEDAEANTDLLENRRWMDLAVVYGSGRNAIITLEKDEEAQALFDKVFTTWAE